jgi:ATP-binding cassette subfamily B protein
MPEIKLNTSEQQKRWEWQQIQEKLFQINLDSLTLGQYQRGGALFISQLKDIFIVFFVAQKVISGHMTLGMMMSIQYIIGQLNGPITQILGFIRAAQDAKISLERLGEVHNQQDEEEWDKKRISIFPRNKNLYLDRLNFQYEGPHSEYVLKDLTMHIPAGKVTAIVGPSGSGKTTLLKLLLKFYAPTCGEIRLGEVALADLDSRVWRRKCGVVMQDGYVFSDTIAENIALADEKVDEHKLLTAVETANIKTFVESLPLGFDTKIGLDGHDLSRGQKQRILIARAVYKNPEYLFFDEATNALDANNEKIIMHNLEDFFAGKTVLIIAHRLSTVKKADQIVVLDDGRIVEQGNHTELTALRGDYYHLVKNQLELGA